MAAAAMAALAAGCGARSLVANGSNSGLGAVGGTGSGGTSGAGGAFTPTRDVDMLFMIDNSSSVRNIQTNLLNNFPTFLATLENSPAGLPNLHIAVITSDLGAGDGSIAGCSASGGDAGRFQYDPRGTCTTTGLAPGATYISNVGGLANYTGSLADVFTCIAAVGETGCGFEQPLGAVVRALGADGSPPPAENQGFLRPDAFLFVVVLTDEDDCSVPPGSGLFDTKSNLTLDSPLGPVTNYRCNEFGHLCNGAKPPRLAPTGSVNDVVTLDGCVSAEDAGLLTPVATLAAQLRSRKAHPDEQILVGVITGPSTPYTVHWQLPSITDPAGPWPEISHSCMSAGSGSFADPAVRINQWASSFGASGQILNVCDNSYGPLLDTLAQRLAQQLPTPPAMP